MYIINNNVHSNKCIGQLTSINLIRHVHGKNHTSRHTLAGCHPFTQPFKILRRKQPPSISNLEKSLQFSISHIKEVFNSLVRGTLANS